MVQMAGTRVKQCQAQMNATNRPAPPSVTVSALRSKESSPGQSPEPGPGLQSLRGHQQREALWHLRLQRLQRLLQAQREEEAHLQARESSRL